jgi:hypothetical protein
MAGDSASGSGYLASAAAVLAAGHDAGVRTPRSAADRLHIVEGKEGMDDRQLNETPGGSEAAMGDSRAQPTTAHRPFTPASVRLFWV